MEAVAKVENPVKDQKQQRRLSKQEEVDLEIESTTTTTVIHQTNSEKNVCVVPVTIHVEDKDVDAGDCYKPGKLSQAEECIESSKECSSVQDSSRQSVSFGNQLAVNGDTCERDKKRNKLLVRSRALPDDASPPPEMDGLRSSGNRLTVSGLGAQTKKGSSSSQGSNDGSSPSLSRGMFAGSDATPFTRHLLNLDSSTETYTDSTGTDLHQFLIDTLQNQKDRIHLLKIEQELTTLVKDNDRQYHKFPPMSSYHRMLVHRVAAFFGMEHNVDTHGSSVVVNKSKTTRLPDLKFADYTKETTGPTDEPKKLILKRDSASFEENSGSSNANGGKEKSPDRRNNNNLVDTRRSKSFEEREEQYEKARARIFNQGSSSSTDAGDGSNVAHSVSDNEHLSTNSNLDRNKNSSPRTSQEEAKTKWSGDAKQWSSTDSDSAARPQYLQLHKQKRMANSLDSDTTKTSITTSSSISSSSGMFLTPDSCVSEKVLGMDKSIRPSVTKASSFGGTTVLSQENNRSSNAGSRLTKAGSFNVSRTNDLSTNCSGAINNGSATVDLKQSYSQSQPPLQISPPSRVSAPTSHSNQNNQRNPHWQGPAESAPQPWLQPQSQPMHILQPSPQLQSWPPYNANGSMVLINGRIVDGNVRGGDKAVPHVVVPPPDGYIPPPFSGDQHQNSYRNHTTADKNGFLPLIPPGQNGTNMSNSVGSQQFQHQHNKHSNNGHSRHSNSTHRLNSQFSSMSINPSDSRQHHHHNHNRGDYSSGKNEGFPKHSYNASMPRNMARAQNPVLPVDGSNGGNPIPLCYVHSLPQNINIGPSQASIPSELMYPNSLQSNVMIVGPNAPVLPPQYQNMPLHLPQGPLSIPQQAPHGPVMLPPNQPQMMRNGQQNIQHPPMSYPVGYPFSSQVHQNTSQGATYPYGAPMKVSAKQLLCFGANIYMQQVPACMPVYVMSNGNNINPNQTSNVRPSTQAGAQVLSAPYPQPAVFRTPSPPQPSQTPPLGMSVGGQQQYIGYTICTPPPPNAPPMNAMSNVSVSQNAVAMNAATQTFMTMLRAQAAATAGNNPNLGNQPPGGKRYSSPSHAQMIPNQNQSMPRFPEFADMHNPSAPNKYPPGSYVLTPQNNVIPGNNAFCRRLPAPISASHPIDLRILNSSPGGPIIGQPSFLVGANAGGKPMPPFTTQGSNTYPNRHKGRRPKTKAFYHHGGTYSSVSYDRTYTSSSQNRRSNLEASNSFSGVVNTSRCSQGLPKKISKSELEEYLKPVKHFMCAIEYFAVKPDEEECLPVDKPLNLQDDVMIESEVLHKVVVSFDNDVNAQQALDCVKNLSFELLHLRVQPVRTETCVTDSKNNVDG